MGGFSIIGYLRILLIEVNKYKLIALGIFVAVSIVILMAGALKPKVFISSSLIYADDRNIIAPLLEGSTKVTKVDYTSEAIDIIQTNQLLNAAALKTGLVNNPNDVDEVSRLANRLGSKVRFRKEGKRYLRLTYASGDPERSFIALNAITASFIEYSANRKLEESRSAFNFIDSQVNKYKVQLETAERELKEFKANNIDGTERDVDGSISKIRSGISDLELSIKEANARIAILEEQLANESPYQRVSITNTANSAQSKVNQLKALESQLANLKLSYTDSHPDVLTVKAQIETLLSNEDIDTSTEESEESGPDTILENPYYDELKSQIIDEQIKIETFQLRINALQEKLTDEYSRKKIVAQNQAMLSELTRDNAVTQSVYEDMLARRESARLSMTLDTEGQGVTYKVHEPATYPRNADGPGIFKYSLIGPVAGLLFSIAAIFGLAFVDQKIRSPEVFTEDPDDIIPLIGVLPQPVIPSKKRSAKINFVAIGLISTVYLAVHFSFAVYVNSLEPTAKLFG